MNKRSIYIIIFIIAVLGFISGFSAGNKLGSLFSFKSNNTVPLPPQFLASPLINSLYANAEGTVTSKTNDYVIIEKYGNSLKLFVEEKNGITTFNKVGEKISLNDINIGDYAKGGISIVIFSENALGLSRSYSKGELIAHYFTITSK